MAAANGVRRVWVGQDTLLSTPAVSAIIRERIAADVSFVSSKVPRVAWTIAVAAYKWIAYLNNVIMYLVVTLSVRPNEEVLNLNVLTSNLYLAVSYQVFQFVPFVG
jgi:hypothetical protein